MAKLIIDNFTGGLIPKYWDNQYNGRIGGEDQYHDGVVNPIKNLGFLLPGNNTYTGLTNATAAISTGNFVKFIQINDGNLSTSYPSVYGGEASKIHGIDMDIPSVVNSGEFPHTITHSGHSTITIDDMVYYKIGGTASLITFFRDTTDGDAISYDLDHTFGTASTAFSGASGGASLDKNYPITAEVADNNYLYVYNGNNFYKFDGTTVGGVNGTVTAVMQLGGGFKVLEAKELKSYQWVLAVESYLSSASSNGYKKFWVYVWDKKATSLTFADAVPINNATEVRGLFIMDGSLHLFAQTTDSITEIQSYSGGSFSTIEEVGGSNSMPANKNSIVVDGKGVYWLGVDHYFYYYGSITAGTKKVFLRLGYNANTSSGALAQPITDTFLVPLTGDLAKWLPYSTTGVPTDKQFRTKFYDLPELSRINYVTLYWPPITVSQQRSATFLIYTNYGATAVGTFVIDYRATPTGEGSRGWKKMVLGAEAFSNINAIQFGFEWSVGGTIGTAIQPYRIEIDYTPISKKK